jgi:hypothetical protein
MTDQAPEQPDEQPDEQSAADAGAAEDTAQNASAENLTPPEGELDPGEATADGEAEANEDTVAAPEVSHGTHHGKHGILQGAARPPHHNSPYRA